MASGQEEKESQGMPEVLVSVVQSNMAFCKVASEQRPLEIREVVWGMAL
jgi:hypothetical protein